MLLYGKFSFTPVLTIFGEIHLFSFSRLHVHEKKMKAPIRQIPCWTEMCGLGKCDMVKGYKVYTIPSRRGEMRVTFSALALY